MAKTATAATVPARLPRRATVIPGLGRRIRDRRIAASLSQLELASQASVALNTLGMLERLDCASRGTLDRIAGVLGLTPEELEGRQP